MEHRRAVLERRRWADVVVIVIGVFELLIAAYGAGLSLPGGVATLVPRLGWLWAAPALAGALAVLSVLLVLRYRTIARVVCGIAGLILVSTLLAYEALDLRAIILFAMPGLLLVVTAPFIGPMPTPEEEGRRR